MTLVISIGSIFDIILLSVSVPSDPNSPVGISGWLLIITATIILLLILFVIIQLTINKAVKISIRSHHYDKNVGLIKVKGFMQKHWTFFDPNEHE